MKKLISLMLTIAMLAALVPATLTGVSAEDVTPPPPPKGIGLTKGILT